jgi:DNA invertase Pin-like site-specific DNA recombinase
MRIGLYLRVSTDSQTVQNQRLELQRYCAARGWDNVREYVDVISGAKDKRPALTQLLADARRRRIDVVCAWSLDRIGRDLKALVLLVDELASLNVTLITLKESLDLGSASGRLMLHLMSALAEFERSRLKERVVVGLQRARAQGKRLGRPRVHAAQIDVPGGNVRAAAAIWGVSKTTAAKWIRLGRQPAA